MSTSEEAMHCQKAPLQHPGWWAPGIPLERPPLTEDMVRKIILVPEQGPASASVSSTHRVAPTEAEVADDPPDDAERTKKRKRDKRPKQ